MSTNSPARGRCIMIDVQGDGATLASAMQAFAALLAGSSLPTAAELPVPPAAIEAPPRRTLAVLARRPSPQKPGRRSAIAGGSLEDRILTAAAEPVTLQHLVDAGGARKPDVKKAVKALIACARLQRTGATTKTRYQAR